MHGTRQEQPLPPSHWQWTLKRSPSRSCSFKPPLLPAASPGCKLYESVPNAHGWVASSSARGEAEQLPARHSADHGRLLARLQQLCPFARAQAGRQQPGHSPEPATENGKYDETKHHLWLCSLPFEAFSHSANNTSTRIWARFFLLHTLRFLSLHAWVSVTFSLLNLFFILWPESVIRHLSSPIFLLLFPRLRCSQQEH